MVPPSQEVAERETMMRENAGDSERRLDVDATHERVAQGGCAGTLGGRGERRLAHLLGWPGAAVRRRLGGRGLCSTDCGALLGDSEQLCTVVTLTGTGLGDEIRSRSSTAHSMGRRAQYPFWLGVQTGDRYYLPGQTAHQTQAAARARHGRRRNEGGV